MRPPAFFATLACLSFAAAADRYPVPKAPAELAAPPAQAITTASGLATLQLRPGSSQAHPGSDDLVTFEYVIWTQDGKVMDSTASLDRPLVKPMARLLKGMREAFPLMAPGEKRRLWLPPALAFAGAANRPAGTLVMDLELLSFEPSPFKAPADVAAPGDEARLLPSGLALQVLRPGQGTAHPARSGQVTVHYSGWTTDGKLFDSSWTGGQPATFRLDQVIKGWAEGLELMVQGEKTRFWVPQSLAYRGKAGMPAGMLVFEIELLAIGK